MSMFNVTEKVKEQYSDDKNLSIRMNLHQKYSVNKQGFLPWLFDKYEFFDGCRILELGCGNGGQWENQIDNLPNKYSLTLSDFSEGMIEIVREKFAAYKKISFQQIDIQNIPFPDEFFDIIIANHMLYHIPDLSKALSEVKRTLGNGGKFYSGAPGNGGMYLFLHNVMKRFNPNTKAFAQELSFNLQNGASILAGYFSNVKRLDYKDSLSITETQDLINWINSAMPMAENSAEENSIIENSIALFEYFEDIRQKKGAIDIPKETGLFISTK